MEIIISIYQAIVSYVYIEYVLAILLVSEILKSALKESGIHPKWIVFGVAIVLGVIGVMVKMDLQKEEISFFKLINSFGVACLGYDYFWKLIKDKYFSSDKTEINK